MLNRPRDKVAVLTSQVVPISQVVLTTGFTVFLFNIFILAKSVAQKLFHPQDVADPPPSRSPPPAPAPPPPPPPPHHHHHPYCLVTLCRIVISNSNRSDMASNSKSCRYSSGIDGVFYLPGI